MTERIEDWVKRLQQGSLPVLRATRTELARLARRGDRASSQEISAAVLRDPLLTLRVIQAANSGRSSRFGTEITTVEHAIMMIGIPPFFKRFGVLPVVEEKLAAKQWALHGFLLASSRSHHAAFQARDWAVIHRDFKAEEAYIAALLCDLPELLLWLHAPDIAINIVRIVQHGGSGEMAQRELLGCEFNELLPLLLQAWQLPEVLQELMGQGSEYQRALSVQLAVSLAHHSTTGWAGDAILADYEAVGSMLQMPADEAAVLVHRNAVIAAQHWDWYGVAPAAAWLPMLPGEWPADSGYVQPKKAERPKHPPVSHPKQKSVLIPNQEKLQKSMQDIKAHLDGSLDLQEMVSLALQGMHEGIGLDCVVFAAPAPDGSKVKARFVVGAGPASNLHRFEFDPREPHLFGRLMNKVQSIWWNAETQAQYAHLMPEPLRKSVGEADFFAMSLFVKDKPVGFIYANRSQGNRKLDENAYQQFKQLCLRVAQGLGYLAPGNK
jgi:HD-like signal output (HDOD) protein